MSDAVAAAEYWNRLYLAGDTGWDKGACSPPIARLLREGVIAPKARIAVVGAGRGHEALEAARLGFTVTAVDFAPEACKAMRANSEAAKVPFEVLEADLFTLPSLRAGQFDAILEHTCFCAIPIERRAEYVEAVHALLAPGGVLFGLFYAHGKPSGPPFDVTDAEVRRLFEPRFTIERLVRATDSFSHRAGLELEAIFRVK